MAQKRFADMTLPEMCAYHMHYGADPRSVHLLLTLIHRDKQEMAALPDAEVQALDEALSGFAAHRRRTLNTYAAYEKWSTQPYEDANPYEHDCTETGCQANCQACDWERHYPGADEDEAYEAARQQWLREEAP